MAVSKCDGVAINSVVWCSTAFEDYRFRRRPKERPGGSPQPNSQLSKSKKKRLLSDLFWQEIDAARIKRINELEKANKLLDQNIRSANDELSRSAITI